MRERLYVLYINNTPMVNTMIITSDVSSGSSKTRVKREPDVKVIEIGPTKIQKTKTAIKPNTKTIDVFDPEAIKESILQG